MPTTPHSVFTARKQPLSLQCIACIGGKAVEEVRDFGRAWSRLKSIRPVPIFSPISSCSFRKTFLLVKTLPLTANSPTTLHDDHRARQFDQALYISKSSIYSQSHHFHP